MATSMAGTDPSNSPNTAITSTTTSTHQQLARRPSPTSTSAAAAVVGAAALAVLLVRKGRVSKARLLELLAAALGGLLSSSCCTVQLVLNSLSLGCAGFAVLDKFRPVFLALTFSSLAYKTWRYDIRMHRSPLRSLPTWLIAAALASSPVVVRAINRRRGLAALVEGVPPPQNPASASAGVAAAGKGAQQLDQGRQQLDQGQRAAGPMKFRVTGMKCEACGNGLRNALEGMGGGVRADVLFEEGVIYVERRGGQQKGGDDEDEEDLEAAVQSVVEEMGYVAERVSPPPLSVSLASHGVAAAAVAASELMPPPQ
jgi:copper chaperone CopZ